MEEMIDATFRCPFNMLISGPTQSGKTTWISRLLVYAGELLETLPSEVHWYSPHATPAPGLSSCVQFPIYYHQRLPWATFKRNDDDDDDDDSNGQENDPKPGSIIVIDDFAQETANSRELTSYITKTSHHRDMSIVLLTQNLFHSGKETRTQSLNMHYMVLMRQTRDHKQIRTLGRQLTQTEKEYRAFLDAYNDATSHRHFSYLLVSMHPRDDKRLLLRGTLFPEEAPAAAVYLVKKYK